MGLLCNACGLHPPFERSKKVLSGFKGVTEVKGGVEGTYFLVQFWEAGAVVRWTHRRYSTAVEAAIAYAQHKRQKADAEGEGEATKKVDPRPAEVHRSSHTPPQVYALRGRSVHSKQSLEGEIGLASVVQKADASIIQTLLPAHEAVSPIEVHRSSHTPAQVYALRGRSVHSKQLLEGEIGLASVVQEADASIIQTPLALLEPSPELPAPHISKQLCGSQGCTRMRYHPGLCTIPQLPSRTRKRFDKLAADAPTAPKRVRVPAKDFSPSSAAAVGAAILTQLSSAPPQRPSVQSATRRSPLEEMVAIATAEIKVVDTWHVPYDAVGVRASPAPSHSHITTFSERTTPASSRGVSQKQVEKSVKFAEAEPTPGLPARPPSPLDMMATIAAYVAASAAACTHVLPLSEPAAHLPLITPCRDDVRGAKEEEVPSSPRDQYLNPIHCQGRDPTNSHRPHGLSDPAIPSTPPASVPSPSVSTVLRPCLTG